MGEVVGATNSKLERKLWWDKHRISSLVEQFTVRQFVMLLCMCTSVHNCVLYIQFTIAIGAFNVIFYIHLLAGSVD